MIIMKLLTIINNDNNNSNDNSDDNDVKDRFTQSIHRKRKTFPNSSPSPQGRFGNVLLVEVAF